MPEFTPEQLAAEKAAAEKADKAHGTHHIAATNKLPDDGDIIEFQRLPVGSLIAAAPKGQPMRRYRVEHKPLDREYLLVDTVSGHASRVPAHEFKRSAWTALSTEVLDKEAKEKAEKDHPLSPAGYPLANQPGATEGDALTGDLANPQDGSNPGLLNLPPLPNAPATP
jgi:hypothetical protein